MTSHQINIRLPGGGQMPSLGLGTGPAEDENVLETALEAALDVGYRHFDTAPTYLNEKILGRVFRKWLDSGKCKREDLFVVSKLPVAGIRASAVEKCLKTTLQDLQLDYVDLYLIHAPFGLQDPGENVHLLESMEQFVIDKETDLIATWKAMEEQVDAGRTKYIGLSNVNENQIQRVLDVARIKPANVQMELHIYHQQRPLVEFCQRNDISVVAYSPLGSRGSGDYFKEKLGVDFQLPDLLQDETVLKIAAKHKKNAGQILLRHIIQRGISTIPRSTNPGRIRTNFQVFDFGLDEEDVAALDKLDRREKGRIFDFTFMPGVKDHPEYPF